MVRGIGLVVVDRVGYLGRRPVPEQRSPDDVPYWERTPDVRIEAVVAVVSQHEHITFRNKLQRCPTEMRRVSTLTQQDEQPCQ